MQLINCKFIFNCVSWIRLKFGHNKHKDKQDERSEQSLGDKTRLWVGLSRRTWNYDSASSPLTTNVSLKTSKVLNALTKERKTIKLLNKIVKKRESDKNGYATAIDVLLAFDFPLTVTLLNTIIAVLILEIWRAMGLVGVEFSIDGARGLDMGWLIAANSV